MRPGALALVNMQVIEPLTAISGDQTYPSDEALRKIFAQVTSHVEYINGEEIAGTLGNLKVANVVLLGALSALLERGGQAGAGLNPEVWLKVITERVPAKHVELNRKAFQAGREAVGMK
jgi:indolepyruvate ferredoxin oxidoreductase beta subunit